MTRSAPLALLPLALLAAGCAPAAAPAPVPSPADGAAPGAPAADPAASGALPPIPRVEGALRPRVVYPPAGTLVAARDSNFIFGSVGHGDATLTIDGRPVPVKPNGSFLAYLPVPAAPRYALVAARGADTARLEHPVRLLPPPALLADTGRLVVDAGSVQPAAPASYPAAEPVRVGVRAPAGATVVVRGGDGRTRPLLRGDGDAWAADVPAAQLGAGAALVVARGRDTVRLPLPAVTALPAGERAWVRLGDASAVDTVERRVVARPTPAGTYKWFLVPGTVVERTAQVGGQARVRLADGLDAWVAADDVRPLPPGTPAPRRVAGSVRLVSSPEWVDVHVPTGTRPPFLVEADGRTLALTLYATVPNTDNVRFGAADPLVRDVRWTAQPGGVARYEVDLAEAPFGWEARWEAGALVLRVRRAPAVDPRAPLRGLRIAVDPGHPPIGATGPTGLYEGEATLAISRRLQAELERRGATVVMTRTTMEPVPLGDRPVLARRADAHALVSVHLNALPDGVNPFPAHGTSTYYFHPHAAALARAVQGGMVRRMGLRDLGVFYGNLALARPTWMPAVLAEGAFMMIPEQEAAMRTAEGQAAYALGVADGVEAFFAGLAREQGGAP